MARILTLNGRTDLLLKIARTAPGTHPEYGFKFSRPVAREFARGFWVQSMLPEKKDIKRALKGFSQLLDIFADAKSKARPEQRLRHDAVILGLHLNMLADASKRFNNGVDYKGFTLKAAEKFLEGIEAANTDLERGLDALKTEAELREKSPKLKHRKDDLFQIVKDTWKDYYPVLEGIQNAKDVLKDSGDVAIQLAAEEERLSEVIKALEQRVGLSMKTGEVGQPKYKYKEASKVLAEQNKEAEQQKDEIVDEVAEEEEAEEKETKA